MRPLPEGASPRTWGNNSASQVQAYEACRRSWYYGWILGLRPPPSVANRLGTEVHAVLEEHGSTGVFDVEKAPEFGDEAVTIAKTVQLISHLLPRPGTTHRERSMYPAASDIIVCGGPSLDGKHVCTHAHPCKIHPGSFGLTLTTPKRDLGGVPLFGYIDVLDVGGRRVVDWKTTASNHYQKTAQELSTNPQMVIYADFLVRLYDANPKLGPAPSAVTVAHAYLYTRGAPQNPMYVPVQLTREHIATQMQRIEGVAESMAQDALRTDPDVITPTDDAKTCATFGGCPHKAYCLGPSKVSTENTMPTMPFAPKPPTGTTPTPPVRPGAQPTQVAGPTPPVRPAAQPVPPVRPAAQQDQATLLRERLSALQGQLPASGQVSPPDAPTTQLAQPAAPPVRPVTPPVTPPVRPVAQTETPAQPTPPVRPAAEPGQPRQRYPRNYIQTMQGLGYNEEQIKRVSLLSAKAICNGGIAANTVSILPNGDHVLVPVADVPKEEPHFQTLRDLGWSEGYPAFDAFSQELLEGIATHKITPEWVSEAEGAFIWATDCDDTNYHGQLVGLHMHDGTVYRPEPAVVVAPAPAPVIVAPTPTPEPVVTFTPPPVIVAVPATEPAPAPVEATPTGIYNFNLFVNTIVSGLTTTDLLDFARQDIEEVCAGMGLPCWAAGKFNGSDARGSIVARVLHRLAHMDTKKPVTLVATGRDALTNDLVAELRRHATVLVFGVSV